MMNVGITLTSSLIVGQEYIDLTRQVAQHLAIEGFGVVYGGTAYGMMLALAESYKEAGGTSLTGVMANDLMQVTRGYVAYNKLDHSFIEETIEDRKKRLIEISDAFLILPGGYGTLEEIGSIVGGRVNKLFDKPIAMLNFQGFYSTFIQFLKEMSEKHFSKISVDDVLFQSSEITDITSYFINYREIDLVDKFV